MPGGCPVPGDPRPEGPQCRGDPSAQDPRAEGAPSHGAPRSHALSPAKLRFNGLRNTDLAEKPLRGNDNTEILPLAASPTPSPCTPGAFQGVGADPSCRPVAEWMGAGWQRDGSGMSAPPYRPSPGVPAHPGDESPPGNTPRWGWILLPLVRMGPAQPWAPWSLGGGSKNFM